MAQKSNAALNTALNTLQPDNNANYITPARNREAIGDGYDSAWNKVDYPDLNNPQGTNKEYFYIGSDQYRIRVNISTNEFEYSFDSGDTWTVAGAASGLFADTGVISYTGATQASTTQINIGAAKGYIVDNETDPENPSFTFIEYAGETNKTVPTLGTGIATYVLLNDSGVIVFQNTFPTSAQRKTHIYLSKVGHPTGTINTVGNEPDFILSPLSQFRDLFQAFNYVNNGVVPSANGANLNINTSTGNICGNGINFAIDKTNPNNYTVAGQAPCSFLPRTQTGAGGAFTTSFDPTTYDVAGTSTAIPGGATTSAIHYLFYAPPLGFILQKAQFTYASLTDAVAAVGKESGYVIYPSLVRNAILVGAIVAKKSCTALNNTADCRIFAADKFGQLLGASSGVSTATLQTAYNNSVTPEIITNSTGGAVTVQRGSAADTDNIYEGKNGAGAVTFSLKGDGVVELNDLKILDFDGVTLKTALESLTTNILRIGKDFTILNIPTFIAPQTTASGTDIAGNSLTIASSPGTSNGAASTIIFQTPSTTGSSGSALQGLNTRLTISQSVASFNVGITTGTVVTSPSYNANGSLSINCGQGALTINGGLAASGTDVAGNSTTISSGRGYGTGTASSLIFQTPTTGVSGAVAQTNATRMTINEATIDMYTNLQIYNGVPSSNPAAGKMYLYIDGGALKARSASGTITTIAAL